MARKSRGERESGRQTGPVRQEQLDQQKAIHSDLSKAASYQIKPETAHPEAMRAEESGAAKASAQAAGDVRPKQENLPSQDASIAAFDASRGGWESKKPAEHRRGRSKDGGRGRR
jgi:hypothetical protein